MELTSELVFDNRARRQIYEHVECAGLAEPSAVREALGIGREEFRHHLSILKRDGYITEQDGTLRIQIDAGDEEEFITDGLLYTIRPARQEDLPGVLNAIRRIAEEKVYIEAESVAEQLDYEDALIRRNSVESRMFFVATVDDEVVGWTHLQAPEIEKLRHTAEITVGVLEEYRSRDIGSHLLYRGLEWAAANGYENVYQCLPATNYRAIEFLECHNGEVEAIHEGRYKIDDRYVDEVLMSFTL